MSRERLETIALSLVILLFGVLVGRLTAPPSAHRTDVAAGPRSPPISSLASAPITPASVGPDNCARGEGCTAPLEIEEPVDAWWQDWEGDERAELIRQLAEWGGDPTEVVGVVIDSMSTRELRSALTSLTKLTEEDLDEIRDLPAFARRVSEIAMDGVVRYGAPEGAGLADVQFSVDPHNVAELAQDRFAGEERIYAVFPMEEYRGDDVFVKWYRSDDPEILLFDRYPILREADSNYVWLDKQHGWPEGEYRVELYSADEAMQKVATGRYVVDP